MVMKKLLQQVLFASLLIFPQLACAQEEPGTKPSTPNWVSDKGFWMIESNIHIPKRCIVYFYANDGQLVYKEVVEGVALKPEKRKVKLHLKRVLETAVANWEKERRAAENQGLVIAYLK
jgi:hypothetical protein